MINSSYRIYLSESKELVNLMKIKLILSLILFPLIIIETIFLFKILFSDNYNIEWGSVSDWFSTASSIITTIIAYFAYKAAPDWLKQKQNETGYNHVCSLMIEYDEIQLNLQRLYFDIICTNSQRETISNMKNLINEQVNKIFALKERLESCKRWKIDAPPEINDAFVHLTDFCNISIILIGYAKSIDQIKYNNEVDKLTNIKKTITLDSKKFKCDIEEIFTFN